MAKILIVDDSETLRMELKGVLEGGGHTVVEGVDGADGLSKALANKDIQLIISDLNMPEVDGVTMCRNIREVPEFASTPIFMLTTESSPEMKAAGKSVGVMLWIIKPFAGDKVLGAITKVVGAG